MNNVIKETLITTGIMIAAGLVGTGIGIGAATVALNRRDKAKAKEIEELLEPSFYGIVKNDDLTDIQKELHIAGEILRLKNRASFIRNDELREATQHRIEEMGESAKDMLKAA